MLLYYPLMQTMEVPMNGDRTYRVLLLEDDEALADGIARVLGAACQVTRASSTEVARALLASHEFDVLVSDFALRGETSEGFLREVAAARPKLRRVLFTGAGGDIIEALHAQGIVDCALQKPFDVVRLLEAIRA